jgi:CubicO group peptidase (beta-lactamase class C family)
MEPAELFRQRAAFVPGSSIAWGILRDGRATFGCTDREHEADYYPIASVTKVLTATLLAVLVRRGVVRLETRVGDLADIDLAPAVAAITLEDLATHTSGLSRLPPALRHPPDPADPYATYDRAALLSFVAAFPPGAIIDGRGTFEYSNFGAALLGTLLAIAAKRDYAELLYDEIFQPLGMNDSFLSLTAPSAPPRPIIAGMNADGVAVTTWRQDAFAPAGAGVSTPRDLIALITELLTGTSPLADALRDATVPRREQRNGRATGLAWMCDGTVRWHNGGTYGNHAMVAVDLSRYEAAVALWNAASSLDDICLHLVNAASPLAVLPEEITLSASQLERFSGTYGTPAGGLVTIAIDASQLRIDGAHGGSCRLYARSDGTFFSKQLPGNTFAFSFDESGNVAGIEQTIVGFTIVRATRRS